MVPRSFSLVGGRRSPFRASRAVAWFLVALSAVPIPGGFSAPPSGHGAPIVASTSSTPVSNFSASIGRLVDLVALAGSGVLSLVWARVALSWFSNDITKKIQAKDRARDALIGTLLFMAAVTGLLYGLAHWVLTGS